MLVFHELCDLAPGEIRAIWTESSRPKIDEVERSIDEAWRAAKDRLGERLFDGPMCRMESWRRDEAGGLQLTLSPTSYRIFLGTHLTRPQLADEYGAAVMANSVGVSCALISNDGFLMLGRRNESVAYYPNRLHPFAGALEPRGAGVDVFDDLRRELREELSFGPDDISEIRCTGIVEDTILRHPELIFAARSTRSRHQIQSQVAHEEHHESWSVPAAPEAIEAALRSDEPFTPVARAALLLFGRIEFGVEWFDRIAPRYGQLRQIIDRDSRTHF